MDPVLPEWNFYNLEAELVKFYGSYAIKSMLEAKYITTRYLPNSCFNISCVDSGSIAFVEWRMKEILDTVKNLHYDNVYIPSCVFHQIVQYLQKRYKISFSTYCKCFTDTSTVRIFSPYMHIINDEVKSLKSEISYQEIRLKDSQIGSEKFEDTSSIPMGKCQTTDICGSRSKDKEQDTPSQNAAFSAHSPKSAVKLFSPDLVTAGIEVFVYKESIVNVDVDIIVNAANKELKHYAGVAKAISDAAGDSLNLESNDIVNRYGKVPVGDNRVTHAGRLPYSYVIHAVGPQWNENQPDVCLELLSDTIEAILGTATIKGGKRLAMPAISSGIFGMPREMCACMYIRGIIKFSRKYRQTTLKEIHFVDIDNEMIDHVKKTISKWKIDSSSVEPNNVLKQHKQISTTAAVRQRKDFAESSRSSTASSSTEGKSYSDVVSEGLSTARMSDNVWTKLKTEQIPGVKDPVHCFETDASFLQVKIYTGSIVRVRNMSGILCSADTTLSGNGPLHAAISKAGGQQYATNFRAMKQKFSFHAFNGHVYSCKGGMLDSEYVVHIVMQNILRTLDSDLQQYKKHIKAAFSQTNKWKMTRIAMPLIGSGFCEDKKSDLLKLCSMVFQAVTEFCQERKTMNLREIHFVNKNSLVSQGLIDIFEKHSTVPEKSSSKSSVSESNFQGSKFEKWSTDEIGHGAKLKQRSKSLYEKRKFQNHHDGNTRPGLSSFRRRGVINEDMESSNLMMKNGGAKQKQSSDHKKLPDYASKSQRRDLSGDSSEDEQTTIRTNQVFPTSNKKNSKSKTANCYDESSSDEDLLLRKSSIVKTKGNKQCDICHKEVDKDDEACLPCGHSFCQIPCFIPMIENQNCFVCKKGTGTTTTRKDTPVHLIGAGEDNSEEKTCVICMDTIKKIMKLGCGHEFCEKCIQMSFQHKPVCPMCGAIFGKLEGDQPDGGKMTVRYDKYKSLPGFEGHGTIEIHYSFRDGIQQENHPEPGKRYKGTERRAFLPMNEEGEMVLELLKVAFERKLTFTIGSSRTTGHENVVTWNDIHHKTKRDTGAARFGYPDPTYLSRVQDELAAKGVTKECLSDF